MGSSQPRGYVLTRLHARYTKENLGEDLVFKAAPPIVGGREFRVKNGELEKRSSPGSVNNFQGRYIIRNPFKGKITCKKPVRGRWGGPSGELDSSPAAPKAAQNLADAERGKVELASIVREDIPEIGVKTEAAVSADAAETAEGSAGAKAPKPSTEKKGKGGGCASVGTPQPTPWVFAALLGLVVARRRR
jgi:MYXO-CTERM domain-containing protein